MFLEKRAKYKAERPEELASPAWPFILAEEVEFEMRLAPYMSPEKPADPAPTPANP